MHKTLFTSLLLVSFLVSESRKATAQVEPQKTTRIEERAILQRQLKEMAKTEAELNRMVEHASVELRYFGKIPTAKQSRIPWTSPEAITAGFLKGKREVVHGISVRDGIRYNNHWVRFAVDGKPVSSEVFSYDGRAAYQDLFSWLPGDHHTSIATIAEGRGGESLLGTLLSQGNGKVIGEEVINGLKTLKVQVDMQQGAQNQDAAVRYLVWLSPERGYRAVRVEKFTQLGDTEYATANSREDVLEFVQFRGAWVPKRTVYCKWLVNRHQQAFFQLLSYKELLQIKTLQSEQRSVFVPNFAPGAYVTDNVRDNAYVVGGEIESFIDIAKTNSLPNDLQSFVINIANDDLGTAKTPLTQIK